MDILVLVLAIALLLMGNSLWSAIVLLAYVTVSFAFAIWDWFNVEETEE